MKTENKTEEPKGRVGRIAFDSLQHRAQNLRYERDDYRGIILSIGDALKEHEGEEEETLTWIQKEVDRILKHRSFCCGRILCTV